MRVPALLLAAVSLAAGARAEWRVTTGFGDSFTAPSDVRFNGGNTSFKVHRARWEGRGFAMPPWYDVRLAWFPKDQNDLGLTLGYTHAKVYLRTDDVRHIDGIIDGEPIDANVPVDQYVQHFSISHGVNFLEIGLLARKRWNKSERFPEGRLQPYVGFSAGPVINHSEATVLRQDLYPNYRSNPNWGFMGMAGIHYAMNHGWGLYAELKQTRVKITAPVAFGDARTTLNSTHVSGGVAYSWK